MAEVLAYQSGAIVSKTLVDTEMATITVFAFDEGQRLSEHTAPHDALLQVLDGTATISIKGSPYSVDAGDAIVIPSDAPHAVEATTEMKMLLTMIRHQPE